MRSQKVYGETRVDPLRRFRAWILLRSFHGDSWDIYRAVHFLRNNDFFFSSYSKEFLRRTDQLVRTRRIVGIRRLLVYATKDELESPDTERIVSMHRVLEGYSCRVIALESYQSAAANFGIHPETDFGVFGRTRVYRARLDRPDFVVGTWSGRSQEVQLYASFFDSCWQSGVTAPARTQSAGNAHDIDAFLDEQWKSA